MSSQKKVTIPVHLTIREESLTALTKGSVAVSPSDALGTRCTMYLENTANGAILLTPDQVAEIEKNFGKAIRGGGDVVRASEGAAQKEDGALAVVSYLDESYKPLIEARAKESGLSVKDMLSELYQVAIANDWIWGITVEGKSTLFKAEDVAFLRAELGTENYSGAQIIALIKSLSRKRRGVDSEVVTA